MSHNYLLNLSRSREEKKPVGAREKKKKQEKRSIFTKTIIKQNKTRPEIKMNQKSNDDINSSNFSRKRPCQPFFFFPQWAALRFNTFRLMNENYLINGQSLLIFSHISKSHANYRKKGTVRIPALPPTMFGLGIIINYINNNLSSF